eukprot:m.109081 g.109081  ORF g.109081 m.109081 type:complete len:778 (+) comp13991_c0_seq2:198-2531(+)
MATLRPVFTVRFGQDVLPGQVAAGKFDGVNAGLACATKTGKVFVHHPHGLLQPIDTTDNVERIRANAGSPSKSSSVSFLNIKKQITGLAAGSLDGSGKDALIIGTANELMAYDVVQNADIFHKEIPDGVLSLVLGAIGKDSQLLAFAGGNCSIQAFDKNGEDKFWTVTGDNVCSMVLCDLVGDGEYQLLVGSEDFDLRVFEHNGNVLHEFSETEAVVGLCNLHGRRFGYALANGAVGAYDGPQRSWRAKHQATPIAILGYDMTMNGVPDLVTAWSDGTLEVREDRPDGSGEVIARDHFPAGLAGIAQADYRMDGTNMLLAVSTTGELRGYLPLGVKPKRRAKDTKRLIPAELAPATPDFAEEEGEEEGEEEAAIEDEENRQLELDEQQRKKEDEERLVRELQLRKQQLISELRALEPSQQEFEEDYGSADRANAILTAQCSTELTVKTGNIQQDGTPTVCITFTIDTDCFVRSVVLFCEDMFEGGSFAVHPLLNTTSSTITASITPPANQSYQLQAQLLIGTNRSSSRLLVKETQVEIPQLALFDLADTPLLSEDSFVHIPMNVANLNKICEWAGKVFLYEFNGKGIHLVYLRTMQPVSIIIEEGRLTVRTQNMDIAADITQSIFRFLNIQQCSSLASFPHEETLLQEILQAINDLQSSRERLAAEMAEKSSVVKQLLFRAEDTRLLEEYDAMTDAYADLARVNRDLNALYTIRCTNHEELLKCLRIVNKHIQRAANLRAGNYKQKVIEGCRRSIKNNDIEGLFQIIHEPPDLGKRV